MQHLILLYIFQLNLKNYTFCIISRLKNEDENSIVNCTPLRTLVHSYKGMEIQSYYQQPICHNQNDVVINNYLTSYGPQQLAKRIHKSHIHENIWTNSSEMINDLILYILSMKLVMLTCSSSTWQHRLDRSQTIWVRLYSVL